MLDVNRRISEERIEVRESFAAYDFIETKSDVQFAKWTEQDDYRTVGWGELSGPEFLKAIVAALVGIFITEGIAGKVFSWLFGRIRRLHRFRRFR